MSGGGTVGCECPYCQTKRRKILAGNEPPPPHRGVDLDRLEALIKAMAPGPWEDPDTGGPHGHVYPAVVRNAADSAGIVALVNAAPELIRLARIGAAYMKEPFPGAEPSDADVERVARYLWASQSINTPMPPWERFSEFFKDEWRRVARAAISAGLKPELIP